MLKRISQWFSDHFPVPRPPHSFHDLVRLGIGASIADRVADANSDEEALEILTKARELHPDLAGVFEMMEQLVKGTYNPTEPRDS